MRCHQCEDGAAEEGAHERFAAGGTDRGDSRACWRRRHGTGRRRRRDNDRRRWRDAAPHVPPPPKNQTVWRGSAQRLPTMGSSHLDRPPRWRQSPRGVQVVIPQKFVASAGPKTVRSCPHAHPHNGPPPCAHMLRHSDKVAVPSNEHHSGQVGEEGEVVSHIQSKLYVCAIFAVRAPEK